MGISKEDIENRFQNVLGLMEDIDDKSANENMEDNYNAAKTKLLYILEDIYTECRKNSIGSELRTFVKDIELNIIRRLGIVYSELTRYDDALIAFEKVLYLHNEKGHRFGILTKDVDIERLLKSPSNNEDKKELITKLSLALTHHDLAVIYTVMKRYDAAEKHFSEAIQLVERAEDTSTEAWFLNDLGWMYHEKGEYKKAREMYKKVLELDVKDKEYKSFYKAYPHFYLGIAYYRDDKEKHMSDIRFHFDESTRIFDERINKLGKNSKESSRYRLIIANIKTNLGRLDLDEHKLETAKTYLKSAVEIYDDYNDHIRNYTPRKRAVMCENVSNAHLLLGKLYFEAGSTRDAKNEFEIAKETSKSTKTKAKYYNNMGCILFKEDEFDKAASKFVRAINTDSSLQSAIDNLKLILKSTKKTVSFNNYWFGEWPNSDEIKNAPWEFIKKFSRNLIKTCMSIGLIVFIIFNGFILMSPEIDNQAERWDYINKWGYVNETTIESVYQGSDHLLNKTTIIDVRSPNFEYNLVLIGLSLLILMLPWIKSFEAFNVKMELKETPVMLTGGAGNSPASPQMDV